MNIANELTVFLCQFICVLSNKEIQIWHSLLIVGRWDIFIDVWHLQYNYCRFRHAVVSAMTGTKKRVGSGHKSARFAELVKQVQSINQASREGKMPAGQCAQPVFWANDKIKELFSWLSKKKLQISHTIALCQKLFHLFKIDSMYMNQNLVATHRHRISSHFTVG